MRPFYPYLMLVCILGVLASCQKEAATSASKTTTSSSVSLSSTASIALASVTDSTGSKDTLYLVNCYPPKDKRDTVAFSALPSTISTYLDSTYSGYTFKKAFSISDSLKVVQAYIVVIKYNGHFVGLKFAADGTFVKVLEQMAGRDRGGKGWHAGGPFSDRGGNGRDTIALSAIPSAVLTYFTTNYPTDTLLHASITPDTNYVLLSKNKVLYATMISSSGTLIKRISLDAKPGLHTTVAESALPAAITTYLTTTYPGYVFNKAFADSINGTVKVYHVFITVNSTNYVIDFDGTGTFIKAITLH